MLANDSDPDEENLAASLVEDVQHGTLTLYADGSFSYVPDEGFVGADSFTYKANDGVDDSDPATVTINVTDGVPISYGESYRITHDATLTVAAADGVLANDSDPDEEALAASLVEDVQHGTLTLYADGSFAYVPDEGFAGADSFTYVASDGLVDGPETTVTIKVVNFVPVVPADYYFATGTNQGLTVAAPGLLAFAADPDEDALTVNLVSDVSHGSLTLNSNGSFSYTPAGNYSGSDSFTAALSDGVGSGANFTVTIAVTSSVLLAQDDTYVVNGFVNGELVVGAAAGLLANDLITLSNPTITITVLSGPSTGSVSVNNDGSFTYTPDQETFDVSDSWTYEVSDGENEAQGTVHIQENALAEVSLHVSGLNWLTTITIGAVVVMNYDDNNAPRHLITVLRVTPDHWVGSVRLSLNQGISGRVTIYNAANDGAQLSFDGNDNVFRTVDLPTQVWVEGTTYSTSSQDVEVRLEAAGVASSPIDTAYFTVLWVTVIVSTDGSVSSDNDKADDWLNRWVSGDGALGLGHKQYDVFSGWGWGYEARGVVSPTTLSYVLAPGLRLSRNVQARFYLNDVASLVRDYDSIPPGNDLSLDEWRDDNPAPNGVIYDLDGPGLTYLRRRPFVNGEHNDIRRIRFNFRSFAFVRTMGQYVRASAVVQSFLRYSMRQINIPRGNIWVQQHDLDSDGDNQAGYGTTTISSTLR